MSPLRLSAFTFAALALAACGPPLQDRNQAASLVAQSSVPASHAQQTALKILAGTAQAVDPLPQPSFSLYGAKGGEARIDFNLVAGAIGLIGEGLLFNVHYSDYSDDGLIRLSGDVAVLANFQYVAADDPYADLKLTLAGDAQVSGVVWDDLHARISLTTRLSELQLRTGELSVRLDGYVDGSQGRFEFQNEDVIALWDQFSR